jgi:hypothetical protein
VTVVGIICPVWVTNAPLLDTLLRAVSTWDLDPPSTRAYLVSNRLHEYSPDDLLRRGGSACPVPVTLLHEDGVSRSVAGAWNHGVDSARRDGCTRFVITAQDVDWRPGSINRLIEFADTRPNDMVSGTHEPDARPGVVSPMCDFSGVTFTDGLFDRIKGFDPGYQPAYFEDNDAVARVWRVGGDTRQFHDATFFHHGSATVKLCPLASHHVRHWFEINRNRFVGRWGCDPVATKSEALGRYTW